MAVQAVIFDIGNVLLRWDPRLLYRQYLPDDAAIDAFLDEVGFAAWNLEQDRGRPWPEAVASLSTMHPHRAELIAAFADRWHEAVPGLIEESVAILAALRDAGLPLYALTNFSAATWAATIARFPILASAFQDVVVSAHEGVVKPDPAIYRLLLARNRLDPAACLFIDDSLANVEAARALGIDAIRFTDAAALRRELRSRGLPV